VLSRKSTRKLSRWYLFPEPDYVASIRWAQLRIIVSVLKQNGPRKLEIFYMMFDCYRLNPDWTRPGPEHYLCYQAQAWASLSAQIATEDPQTCSRSRLLITVLRRTRHVNKRSVTVVSGTEVGIFTTHPTCSNSEPNFWVGDLPRDDTPVRLSLRYTGKWCPGLSRPQKYWETPRGREREGK
jgi:hypothetical protein